jgi:hypothetical protein
MTPTPQPDPWCHEWGPSRLPVISSPRGRTVGTSPSERPPYSLHRWRSCIRARTTDHLIAAFPHIVERLGSSPHATGSRVCSFGGRQPGETAYRTWPSQLSGRVSTRIRGRRANRHRAGPRASAGNEA